MAPALPVSPQEFGVKYTSYWNWDAGFGWTYKAFTLDLRYYDTNLTHAECNAFTSASNSSFSPSNVTTQNPSGSGLQLVRCRLYRQALLRGEPQRPEVSIG